MLCRHTILNLLDEHDWSPGAVYWVAVLWRRLMGRSVLNTSTSSPMVVSFAHVCTDGSSTAVAFANLANATTMLADPFGPHCATRSEYILTAADGLNNTAVLLNGVQLVASEAGTLPPLEPRVHQCGSPRKPVVLPPQSYGFIVYGVVSMDNYQ